MMQGKLDRSSDQYFQRMNLSEGELSMRSKRIPCQLLLASWLMIFTSPSLSSAQFGGRENPDTSTESISVHNVQNMSVDAAAELIRGLFPDTNVVADSRTNSIVIVAGDITTKKIAAFLSRMDDMPADARFRVHPTIWGGRVAKSGDAGH